MLPMILLFYIHQMRIWTVIFVLKMYYIQHIAKVLSILLQQIFLCNKINKDILIFYYILIMSKFHCYASYGCLP